MSRVESIASTWVALFALCLAGGCAVAPVDWPEPDAPFPADPQPAAEAVVPAAAPAPAAELPAEARPAPPPAPPDRVLVLLPPGMDAFAAVLPELEARLAAREVVTSRVTLDRLEADDVLGEDAPSLVITVGSAATRAALERLDARVLFCQVPDLDFDMANAHGVASLPPLDLQLRAWRRLDPMLRKIGLVLGRDEALLAARAAHAAAALGLALELRVASSDQEAIYHFKRMATDLDGLWLLPDNTVLSPRAIREMLDYAAQRGVETLVFTPSLLEWGALLSVAPTDLDLARTLAEVAGVLLDGGADALSPITPLSELEARVNVRAAERLGLARPRDVWIERSENP